MFQHQHWFYFIVSRFFFPLNLKPSGYYCDYMYFNLNKVVILIQTKIELIDFFLLQRPNSPLKLKFQYPHNVYLLALNPFPIPCCDYFIIKSMQKCMQQIFYFSCSSQMRLNCMLVFWLHRRMMSCLKKLILLSKSKCFRRNQFTFTPIFIHRKWLEL